MYNETHLNNQINDKDTVKFHAIYDVLVRQTSHRALTDPSPEHNQGNSQSPTARQQSTYRQT
jgi:hypothetical protein